MMKGACMAKGDMHGERGACMVKGGCAWYVHLPLPDTAGQCVGGTHPTGMHSCLEYFYKFIHVLHDHSSCLYYLNT